MLPLRRLLPLSHKLLPRHIYYSTAPNTSDRIPTNNDPNSPHLPVQNVSDSNAVPIDSQGKQDAPLQELPEDAERRRQMQAPNREDVWSRSQARRDVAMSGPRFEQTIMEFQVCRRVFFRRGNEWECWFWFFVVG